MTLGPAPQLPERSPQSYQRGYGTNPGGNKGPLRFEEGIATDTDVPNDFGRGAYADGQPAAGRSNHNNPDVQYKHANETLRERAHVGSASWIEAPSVLQEFVQGSQTGYSAPSYEMERNPGTKVNRQAPTVISG